MKLLDLIYCEILKVTVLRGFDMDRNREQGESVRRDAEDSLVDYDRAPLVKLKNKKL